MLEVVHYVTLHLMKISMNANISLSLPSLPLTLSLMVNLWAFSSLLYSIYPDVLKILLHFYPSVQILSRCTIFYPPIQILICKGAILEEGSRYPINCYRNQVRG